MVYKTDRRHRLQSLGFFGPAELTTWTVKKLTGIQLGGDERLTLQLDSLNPAYAQRQVVIGASSDTAVEAVLLEPLPTAASSPGRAKP